jgi:hypothetical protein
VSERLPISQLPDHVSWVLRELNLVSADDTVDRRHVQVLGEWVLRFAPGAEPEKPRTRTRSVPTKAEQRSELTRMITSFLDSHPGATMSEIAMAFDISIHDATSASRPVDWLILGDDELTEPVDRPESPAIAATRERARAALQAASLLVSPLSHQNYTGLIRDGRVKGPSVARIVQLFGSWTSACAQVGVASGEPLRKNYERTWSKDELLVFVQRFLRNHTYRGASHQFDVWRSTVNGTEKVPSLGTVRNIVGGTWSDIRTEALRRMRAAWVD